VPCGCSGGTLKCSASVSNPNGEILNFCNHLHLEVDKQSSSRSTVVFRINKPKAARVNPSLHRGIRQMIAPYIFIEHFILPRFESCAAAWNPRWRRLTKALVLEAVSGRPTDHRDSYSGLTTCGGASGLRLEGGGLRSPGLAHDWSDPQN